MRISTADFLKNFGAVADQALSEPVTITKNGRDRLVVISAGEYERLTRRDRRVVAAGELTDNEVEAIANAEVPASLAHLDEEIDEASS
jgi:prevent-host-death family protein